jgi:hypothetical protein
MRLSEYWKVRNHYWSRQLYADDEYAAIRALMVTIERLGLA